MTEDLFFAARPANAFDHGIMVPRVGQDERIRQHAGDCRDRRQVRDPPRGEDQRRLLVVQTCKLTLELDDWMGVSGDVTRAARARPEAGRAASRMASITVGWLPMPR